MIKPTVGRVVLFSKTAAAPAHAALITYVWSDTLVNVAAFDNNGCAYAATSVQLMQEGEKLPEGHYCTWMPYQVGQARKQELNLTISVSGDTATALERIIQRLDKEMQKELG